MVQQRFTSSFDFFQVKYILQNQHFGGTLQSVPTYSTPIECYIYVFGKYMSKIGVSEKHMIAEKI
jgi:hypothetical protein